MKKSVSLLLAGAMCAGLLAGCSSSSTSGGASAVYKGPLVHGAEPRESSRVRHGDFLVEMIGYILLNPPNMGVALLGLLRKAKENP